MGLSFKDQLAADLSAVFFNAGEFAEEIFWDGEPLLAVVEDIEIRGGMPEAGLEQKVVRVRKADIRVRLQEGDQVRLTLDPGLVDGGEVWSIARVRDNAGEYEILFTRYTP